MPFSNSRLFRSALAAVASFRALNGDLSDIKKYAAIGDSYAAGIGAGEKLHGDLAQKCSQYDQSYPSYINSSEALGLDTFDYLACSGDESPEIREQAAKLGNDYDVITVSAGGNDLGFSSIVMRCIYLQWLGGCEDALVFAEKTASSDGFKKNITALIGETKKHLSENGNIYWTGYGHFFNTETTVCDEVPGNLTTQFRQRTNKIVDQLNKQLSTMVTDAGFTFIDWSQYTGGWLSQFCDPGSVETPILDMVAVDSDPDHWNKMFFQFRPDDQAKEKIEEAKEMEGERTDLARRGAIMDIVQLFVDPDLFMKAFHPRPVLHNFIANLVLKSIRGSLIARKGGKIAITTHDLHEKTTCAPGKNDKTSDFKPTSYCNLQDQAGSGLPSSVFKDKMYAQFCEGIDEVKDGETSRTWIVNSEGEKINRQHRIRDLEARAPPVSASSYSEYNATLRFERENKKGLDCVWSCKKAFSDLASSCGSTGRQMYDLSVEGTIDVGCGNYSYTVKSPAKEEEEEEEEEDSYVALEIGEPECYKTHQFGKHPNFGNYTDDSDMWENLVYKGCGASMTDQRMSNEHTGKDAPFVTTNWVLNTWWRKDCQLEGKTEQRLDYPLGEDIEGVTCGQMYTRAWDHCNWEREDGKYGGSGGYVDVGCVRYTIKATGAD